MENNAKEYNWGYVKTFSEQLLSKALYGSRIEICDGDVTLVLPKDGDSIVFISRDHNEAWREKTRQTAS